MDRNRLHYVQPSPGISIIRASEIKLDISTADTDEQGVYLSNRGTNRSLACGIAEDGTLTLLLRTNGDDEAACDDAETIRCMAETMADLPSRDIATGFARLRSAIEAMREIYNTDAASEQIDEIESWIDAAEHAE